MVNGKPTLTFGGVAAPTSPATNRQGGRSASVARAADSFASYLPHAELGKPDRTLPSARAAAQGIGQSGRFGEGVPSIMGPAGIPTAKAPLSSPSAAQARANTQGLSKTPMGFSPDNYISGPVQDYSGQNGADAANTLPAGQNSRAQARNQAVQGLRQNALLSNAAGGRQARKSSPRISGVPITGRNHIGMVDTRKTADNPAPAGKGTLNYASRKSTPAPAANAGPAQGSALPLPANSAYNHYSAMFGDLGGAHSPQSFVSHGFAGKNAELALKKLGYDLNEASSITTYAKRLEPDPYELNQDGYGNATRTRTVSRPGREEGAISAIQTSSHRKKREKLQADAVKNDTLPARAYPERSLVPALHASAGKGLGNLAAKFESGSEGIAAIGYDRKGGTSYGKYQIASRVGTMSAFIDYLRDKAPDIAKRLSAAGPANTGGRNGGMPAEWRKIASEDPQRFESLQSDFIRTSHFEPAMRSIASSTGVAFEKMPVALQEVLFSTAVQHGPAGATRIVSQALQRVGQQKLQNGDNRKSPTARKAEEQLITHIYNLRANQFASSTTSVQAAVRNRLKQEMREAIQMLA